MSAFRLQCAYCSKHKLSPSSLFDEKPGHICSCCGTNIDKELADEKVAMQAATERSSKWGGMMPFNVQMGDSAVCDEEEVSERICHFPSIQEEWLPEWFISMADEKGFCFNGGIDKQPDASASSNNRPSVGVQVARLWKRVMPRSNCWQIQIPNRAVAFDKGSGEVAGAVYFDIGNKYIACVGVDENYRRRHLGSLLVVLAVIICESSNALIPGEGAAMSAKSGGGVMRYGERARCFIAGARPNLCVSPKDLASSPHLHHFYTKLGFTGGNEETGGNYVLSEEAGVNMLDKLLNGF